MLLATVERTWSTNEETSKNRAQTALQENQDVCHGHR